MTVVYEEYNIESKERREIINITNIVEDFVRKRKLKDGILLIFLPHSTAALSANEDERYIREDYIRFLDKLVPEHDKYKHNIIDNNADSHLLSFLFKQFYLVPVINGKIVRGTWQDIFLLEFDGPRVRKMFFVFIGETLS